MIKQTIEDNILIARLDNPPTNSITFEALTQMRGAIKKVNEDEAIKGLIITGEGRFFSSGFHLPTFIAFQTREEVLKFFDVEEEMLYELFTCKKPVIAAINGHCAAGGFITAMGCDYRIAVDHPKPRMGMTEIKIGLGLTIAEMELVRYGLNSDRDLRDVMYNGNMYSFQDALAKGYFDELVEPDNLIETAKAKICSWIDLPGKAFINIKYGMRAPAAASLRTRLDNENWQDALCECILNPQVKGVLGLVHKSMTGGK